jgi:ectoine hydroxylase-related dioxygenase (phytanoyl-CoA dioxygenase family)
MDPADLATLEREGFVVVEGALDPDLCARANADIDEFKAANRSVLRRNLDAAGRMHRVVNFHVASAALTKLFSENSALELCDRFFDDETALYTSVFFERGSQQDLHRDSPVFVTRPEGKYLGVWVALEPTDGDNGPIVAVPGSHLLPPIDIRAMATKLYGAPSNAPAHDEDGWVAYQTTVQEQATAAGLEPVEVHVQTGDVIVWHPLFLHGGAAQRVPERTRRSIVMHVTPRGMPVYQQDVFFDPDKDVPSVADFGYFTDGGRAIAKVGNIDFNHEFTVSTSRLHRPGEGAKRRFEVTARRAKERIFS